MCRTSSSSLLLLFLDLSMADGDGALDVLVPLFPSTSCCLVDGSLLVSLVEVLFTYWCRLVLFRRLFDRWHLMLCLTSFWEFGVPGSFVCNVALSLALRINY